MAIAEITNTISTTIDTAPTAPTRGDPANFRTEADDYILWQATDMVPQQNAIVEDFNSAIADINLRIGEINTTTTNINNAEAVSLAAANFHGPWSDLTGAANIPFSVFHSDRYWMLLSNLVNITTKEPGVDTEWVEIYSKPIKQRETRISNTILGEADAHKLIVITSGTFTQTFTAAATLKNGWYIYYKNAGTGDITLDPNSSETIDGLSSFIMYPNEMRLIFCDGTGFYSVVLSSFIRTWLSTGTFIKPPGYQSFDNDLWSGGGSGAKGGTSTYTFASGGGGGGRFKIRLPASSYGSTETVTIGAGGAPVSASETVGNPGGNTSIGSLILVNGGLGGKKSSGEIEGGIGGGVTFSNTSGLHDGFSGAYATTTIAQNHAFFGGAAGGAAAYSSIAGGNSTFGGAGGGAIANGYTPSAGGTSTYSGSGGAAVQAGSGGIDGTFPSGGGGATITGTDSGAGADGKAEISGVI